MTQEQAQPGQIETWAIVEIFGHQKIVGFCRTVAMGSACMLRVDVPELPEEQQEYGAYKWNEKTQMNETVRKTRTLAAVPSFTRFLGISSIFSLTPCSEEFARAAQKRMRIAPPTMVEMPQQRALPAPDDGDDEEEGYGDEG